MSSIKYDRDDDGVTSFQIDGEEYADESEFVTIPVSVLKNIDLSDIPYDVNIGICESKTLNCVSVRIPAWIRKISENEFYVQYEDSETRKYWNGSVGLKLYMETKRDIIEDRCQKVGDVNMEHYDDDGVYIHLQFSSKMIVDSMEGLLCDIEQLYGEIEGATDIALGSPFPQIESCGKESEFTIRILLPLFRKLGFSNVKYNHGNREFGKDITFARRTEFDQYEYYGVQVKYGDVSGNAHGEINDLIIQARDAFSMPFYDVYSRSKVHVAKVIIAISGKFTQNAVEKIVEGINDYPLKNNLIFLDGEKIENLMSRYNRF